MNSERANELIPPELQNSKKIPKHEATKTINSGKSFQEFPNSAEKDFSSGNNHRICPHCFPFSAHQNPNPSDYDSPDLPRPCPCRHINKP